MYFSAWASVLTTYLLLRIHYKFNSTKIAACLVLPIMVFLPLTLGWIMQSGEAYVQGKKDAGTSPNDMRGMHLCAKGGFSILLVMTALNVIACVFLAYFTDVTEGKLHVGLLVAEAVYALTCTVLVGLMFFTLAIDNACAKAGPDCSFSESGIQEVITGERFAT
ncbi:hypothetical protein NSE_0090 [Neorickettsia sennetsu str. Miyayama]|uniref:Uncharacterized protein n=2 Tax=Ehrlichia sennetsu TaxID=951 RepID=Q2GEV5_EHRS3|nr:hypothetical protein NSE_0090 [Neorickettsia sennetsu str. Miyayama]